MSERLNEEYKPIIDPLKTIAANSRTESNNNVENERKYVDIKKIKKLSSRKIDFNAFRKNYKMVPKRLFTSSSKKKKKKNYDSNDSVDAENSPIDISVNKTIAGTSSIDSPSTSPTEFFSEVDDDDDNDNDVNSEVSTIPRTRRLARKQEESAAKLKPPRSKKVYYTIRLDNFGVPYLGKYEVAYTATFIKIKSQRYKRSVGLSQLLCQDHPHGYDANDLKVYKDILISTNAHRRDFNSSGNIIRDDSDKYNRIIKKLFPIEGEGGNKNKLQTKYIYDCGWKK